MDNAIYLHRENNSVDGPIGGVRMPIYGKSVVDYRFNVVTVQLFNESLRRSHPWLSRSPIIREIRDIRGFLALVSLTSVK